MAIPPLPSQGATNWLPWAAGVDAVSRGLPIPGSYTYNPDGTVATGPAGESYTYNSDGTVNTVSLNGITRTYSYDANLNVTGVA